MITLVGPLLVFSVISVQSEKITESPKIDLRCGSYCLYVALKALDVDVASFEDFENKLGQPGRLGYSMEQLAAIAKQFGLQTQGVVTKLDTLSQRDGQFVCIALLEKGHFVNIIDIKDNLVFLIDPPNERKMAIEAFESQWDGKALLLSREPLRDPKIWNYRRVFIYTAIIGAIVLIFFSIARIIKHVRN